MMEPRMGGVVLVQTTLGPRLGIWKADFNTMRSRNLETKEESRLKSAMIYVPTVGDRLIEKESILDYFPTCDTCDSADWYWQGELPLFPDTILCARCHPANISIDARREAIEQACSVIQSKMPDLTQVIRENEEVFIELPWHDLQKRLFILWVGSVANIRNP